MFVLNILCNICSVRIDQRVGYELIESGYETSEPGWVRIVWVQKTTGKQISINLGKTFLHISSIRKIAVA